MREILFRAKRIDNGEWTEGYVFELQPGQYMICDRIQYDRPSTLPVWEFFRYCTHEIVPETLCQYTGLKDMNGNLIWENDIVSGYFNHKKITGFIKYGSNAVYYIEREGSYGIHLDNSEDWLEVIGNIFDTPELLKGE